MDKETKRKEEIEKLIKKGGDDRDLMLFDKVNELEDKFDSSVNEMKATIPDLETVLASVRGTPGKDAKAMDVATELRKDAGFIESLKPEDGKDYILTEEDKEEIAKGIAKNIKVPVVEKVIEKTETIVVEKQPIITKEIKEILDEKKLEEVLPKFGAIFRDGLELLHEGERISQDAVEGLPNKISQLETEIKNIPRSRGMRKVPIIKRYNLTNQTDGIKKAFILPFDTVDVVGLWGTQFPNIFDPDADWTFTGRTLTLGSSITAPQQGQTLVAIIETLFYG